MAQGLQNTSSVGQHTFDKELNKDVNDFHLPPNSWGHARNAINNSKTGDLGKIGNEPANAFCTETPYQVIGGIHLEADKWALFSTNGTNSEIGLYFEATCQYFTAVNANCLAFTANNLIKGASRATADCVYEVYWDDGLNNSRYITLSLDPLLNPSTNPNSPIPWIQVLNPLNIPPCQDMINTPDLDCSKLRVAKLINSPCVEVIKGVSGGTLLNGSYFVVIAYSISEQKVSDWYISNVQALFEHDNSASSLDVNLISIDTRFDEILVGIGSIVNQQTVIRQAGPYSTHQKRLSFDVIQDNWPAIPIEQVSIMTPIPDKSDAMYNVGPYLIRVGPTSKFDFNYQPRANQIRTKWVSVEYLDKYYRKGGNNVGYLRDETYAFFIRWVYDTGDKSASYHIPGRPAISYAPAGGGLENGPYGGIEALPGDTKVFESFNTATFVGPPTNIILPDGGVQIREGYMGYWESSENYPDDNPVVWDANAVGVPPYPGTSLTDYNLCGKKIRHHKFPEDKLSNETTLFNSGVGDKIRVMGIKFENVLPPVDNLGVPIPNIVGYEILRGSRNGNKTILAKGIINNMGMYALEGQPGKVGAYPNYPYNDLNLDPFLSTTQTNNQFNIYGIPAGSTNYNPPDSFVAPGFYAGPANFSANYHTFHSPDTNFTNPFLDAKELKIYGNVYGEVVGKFETSEKHPKEKLLTNFAFLISAVAGVGIASLAMGGKRTSRYIPPKSRGYSETDFVPIQDTYGLVAVVAPANTTTTTGAVLHATAPFKVEPTFTDQALIPTLTAAIEGTLTAFDSTWAFNSLLAALVGVVPVSSLYNGLQTGLNATTVATQAFSNAVTEYDQEDSSLGRIPQPFRTFQAIPLFMNYFTEGADTIIRLIKAVVRFRDFALRYHSHGFYNNFGPTRGSGENRRVITDEQYIGPQRAEFGSTPNKVQINNLYRARTVALELGTPLLDPTTQDASRYKVTDINTSAFIKNPTRSYVTRNNINNSNIILQPGQQHQTASSHYTALKQRIVNQYGQLTNITEVPIPMCVTPITQSFTEVLFGGDTYIGRYTEKNSFFYFYEWLYNQPDGGQLDYNSHKMFSGLFPTFWANFNEFETSDFTSTVLPGILGWIINPTNTPANIITPSDFYALDYNPSFLGSFSFNAKHAWFYLFNSGVRDFFVESEINVDLRDWGNTETELYYDPYRYADTKALFDTAIIKSGNFYKYDQSLSVSKLFINYTSWASMQERSYNPFLAETCYVYRPRRVIYSLPAQFEGRRDNWLIFLANNYYDFLSRVTSIKSINKNGAIIFFESAAPVQFQGTDQLQTSLGTKLTIGDGGLFSQPLQELSNADRSYEYGSCQDRLSVINTPAGLFWMSQNQGKIFNYAGGINPISDHQLKWWFTNYLPYKLTQLFPNFQLIDNPVIGIGCQAVYDNENGLAYFCKKDYVLRAGFTASKLFDPVTNPNPGDGTIGYLGGNLFRYLPTGLTITLGDPLYFEDASWTVSYDPKTQAWLGWHDWHPELLLPGKNTFMSIVTNPISKKGGIWIHNERCDLYCNYYDIDYPFEVEYMINTPQQVNTLRSIEYYMEVYKYDSNCYDRFHVLDYNFDESVIYNTEQCSGMLRLNPSPRLDPNLIISYPIINPTSIDILFSKVENKYRFNQFWDITDDRGEYPAYPLPPGAQRMIWNTGANGYIKSLNPANLNYNKSELQRKKFRHYTNSVFLRKRVIFGQQIKYKILVMITDNKQLYSPR